MSNWTAKRFWKDAAVSNVDGGFSVTLDGRAVKTPAKRLLIVPTRAMAQAIADEWQAQEDEINPASMPVTRAANAALDKVAQQKHEVAEMLAAYGDSDLLCYRADSPEGLVKRQSDAWDPLLDWAQQTFGARLEPRTGVIHAAQNKADLEKLTAPVFAMDIFTLTAFHDLVGMSGSLILGFAALHDVAPPEEIWRLSRVDELWQEEQWGPDEEAQKIAKLKESDFVSAKTFHKLAQNYL